jgi:hypothetical protein
LFVLTAAFGQAQTENTRPPFELNPGATVEHEMKGAESHRYKFDLKKDEFFQVRVEQKGVDVSLKLTDDKGNVAATMDSPNGKEGFETLTWVAIDLDKFILEVIGPNEKTERGSYPLKRQQSRVASEKDKRRMEVEKVFSEAMKTFNSDMKNSREKFKVTLTFWDEIGEKELAKLTLEYIEVQEIFILVSEAQKHF